ncbi:MAG: Cysteine desulfuration protein sufE [Bacteroidota bacterium]|jgi:cysteine desulfuration protein SufE
MSIAQKQIELIEEFAMFPSWMEKYEYIIELGKDLQTLPEELKNEDHLIKGCQSRVWISASKNADGTLHFEADSDAIITKGMVSLIVRIFEGEKGQDIVDAPMEFLKEIGLMENLSPTRSNGLAAMIKQIKTYGLLMQ